MADLLQRSDGALRQAEAVMRVNGGSYAVLRLPAPAIPNDASEQLGLATPQFQDLPLGPVVFRKKNSVKTLLVAASAVMAITQSLAYDSADVLFETAVGVVIGDVTYAIEASVATIAFGKPYSYTLTLRPPVR